MLLGAPVLLPDGIEESHAADAGKRLLRNQDPRIMPVRQGAEFDLAILDRLTLGQTTIDLEAFLGILVDEICHQRGADLHYLPPEEITIGIYT